MPTITCDICGKSLEGRTSRAKRCHGACFRAAEAAYSKRVRKTWSIHHRRAHDRVLTAVLRGRLVKQPCEVCGSKDSCAHHDDYAKPLDVRWLCRNHHAQHHVAHGRALNY